MGTSISGDIKLPSVAGLLGTSATDTATALCTTTLNNNIIMLYNAGSNPVVLGVSNGVTFAGAYSFLKLLPGETLIFDRNEFQGIIYGICDTGLSSMVRGLIT